MKELEYICCYGIVHVNKNVQALQTMVVLTPSSLLLHETTMRTLFLWRSISTSMIIWRKYVHHFGFRNDLKKMICEMLNDHDDKI